jgi:hypothetical protein
MNYLVLANLAPNYFNFFAPLTSELRNRGHQVFYVLDSQTSVDYNSLHHECNRFVFSDFMKNEVKRSVSGEAVYAKIRNKNRLWNFFPDYDRSMYYHIISRNMSNHAEILVEGMFWFLYNIIIQNDIRGIFYENASNLLALTAEAICHELLEVQYYGLEFSRLPGRFFIAEDYRNNSRKIENMLQVIQMGKECISRDTRQYVEEYLEKFMMTVPTYMKTNGLADGFFKRYFRPEKFKILFFRIKHSFGVDKYDFQTGNQLKVSAGMVWRYFKRMLRSWRVKHLYARDIQPERERFIFYPLHFHPEASTSVVACNYGSELEVIRNLAFNLPRGVKLYVKEHPSAVALESYSFYDAICRLPGVRFIPHYFNAKELIRQSLGVVTLTSTAGYEALILKKKVLLFGNVFYQCHKNVRKVGCLVELPNDLDWLIAPVNDQGLDGYNFDFVAAYYLSTFPMNLNYNIGDAEIQKKNARAFLQAAGIQAI